MVAFDATEALTPCRDGRGIGAILFDRERLRLAEIELFMREGLRYKAAILMERLEGVRSLADRALVAGRGAPWEETGRLIARFHRAGLDHADLNAHNILFDANGHGWLIDFDRGVLRIPATRWRERNLKRLLRSLIKLRGERSHEDVEKDYARLRRAYDLAWNRGY